MRCLFYVYLLISLLVERVSLLCLLSLLSHSLREEICWGSSTYSLLPYIVLGDDKGVSDEPIIKINHFPSRERMLANPFHQVLALAPLVELHWWFTLGLKDAYMLPCVVRWIIKHLLAVFIKHVDLVSCLKSHICSICHLVCL